MTTDTTNAYLRTKVLTASPEQLRLMLIEGAIRFTRQGREALDKKDYEGIYTGFNKARNIILELMNSIGPDLDPALRANINGLYTFMYTQLVEASFEKDAAKAEKVIDLLEFERETWVLAMQKAAEERKGAGGAANPPTPTVLSQADPSAPRPALSLQG